MIYNSNLEILHNYDKEAELIAVLNDVRDLVLRICPENWKGIVQKNYTSFEFIMADADGRYTVMKNGEKIQGILPPNTIARCTRNNYVQNTNEFSANPVIVMRPGFTLHLLKHENFHGLLQTLYREENHDVIRDGSRIVRLNKESGKIEKDVGLATYEGITEALVARSEGKFLNEGGKRYDGTSVLSTILIGHRLEKNSYLHKILFGSEADAKKFAIEFDSLTSGVRYHICQNAGFLDMQFLNSPSPSGYAFEFFKSAAEYCLKKVDSIAELRKEIAFLRRLFEAIENKYGWKRHSLDIYAFCDKVMRECEMALFTPRKRNMFVR